MISVIVKDSNYFWVRIARGSTKCKSRKGKFFFLFLFFLSVQLNKTWSKLRQKTSLLKSRAVMNDDTESVSTSWKRVQRTLPSSFQDLELIRTANESRVTRAWLYGQNHQEELRTEVLIFFFQVWFIHCFDKKFSMGFFCDSALKFTHTKNWKEKSLSTNHTQWQQVMQSKVLLVLYKGSSNNIFKTHFRFRFHAKSMNNDGTFLQLFWTMQKETTSSFIITRSSLDTWLRF